MSEQSMADAHPEITVEVLVGVPGHRRGERFTTGRTEILDQWLEQGWVAEVESDNPANNIPANVTEAPDGAGDRSDHA